MENVELTVLEVFEEDRFVRFQTQDGLVFTYNHNDHVVDHDVEATCHFNVICNSHLGVAIAHAIFTNYKYTDVCQSYCELTCLRGKQLTIKL